MQNEPQRPILSVSELLRSVRDTLERRFPLLWVRGELSNLNYAASGHCYFTLKDRGAQVDCVMYRSRAQAFDASLREGMQVEAQVLVSLYEPRGRFQLTVENLRPAGLGPLYERFLRLKEKLECEGLFDPASKRALAPYPRTIGVVTSRAAAALRDVLTTLARRNPAVRVIVYPTPVHGAGARRLREAPGASGRAAAPLGRAPDRATVAPRFGARPSRAPLRIASAPAAGVARRARSRGGPRARLQHHAYSDGRSAARRVAGA